MFKVQLSCPGTGHKLPGHWAQVARALGKSCPGTGHKLPGHWTQVARGHARAGPGVATPLLIMIIM